MTFGGDAAYMCAGPADDRAPAKACASIDRTSTGSYTYTFIQLFAKAPEKGGVEFVRWDNCAPSAPASSASTRASTST